MEGRVGEEPVGDGEEDGEASDGAALVGDGGALSHGDGEELVGGGVGLSHGDGVGLSLGDGGVLSRGDGIGRFTVSPAQASAGEE